MNRHNNIFQTSWQWSCLELDLYGIILEFPLTKYLCFVFRWSHNITDFFKEEPVGADSVTKRLQRWWKFGSIGIQHVDNVIFWDPECIYPYSTTKADLKIGFRIENNCESSQILGSENLNHRIAPRDKKITQFRKHHSMRNDDKYLHPNFGDVWSSTDFSRIDSLSTPLAPL